MRRQIGKDAGGGEAALEGERVGEGLEGRTGLARADDAVDRAAMVGVEVVPRSFPGQPLAAAVVEDGDGRRVRAVVAQPVAVHLEDAPHLGLQRGVEGGLDPPWPRPGQRRENALDEVVRGKRGRVADEPQALGESPGQLVGVEIALLRHPRQHPSLPAQGGVEVAIRIENRGPLGQAGQEGGLRRRQAGGPAAEVAPARRFGSHALVAVRREAQVEGQDLAFAQAVLEPQRKHGLAQLPAQGARAVDEELRRLLRQRRAAFGHPSRLQVVPERAKNRERVHAGVGEEAPVLGGERGLDERLGQAVGGQEPAPRGVGGERFVERHAAAVDHFRRDLVGRREQPVGQRSAAYPRGGEQRQEPDAVGERPSCHGVTSITADSVRPKTSGSYISSARAGAVRKVPAVVARTT